MSSNLKVFENEEFGSIRTLEIDGEPYLGGTDVANILGYTNPQKAIRDHVDEEDKTVNDSFTVNGTRCILINESGLYSLILSSKLPKAKQFKRWVTSEILPSIRKTGMYATDELLNNPDLAIKAFTALKEEREKNKLLTEENAKKQNLLNEISPKAEFAEHLIDDGRLITATEIAKDYGMTSRQLNSLLNEFKIQFKVNGRWVLHKQYADKDYAQTVSCFDRYSGAERRSLKWTYKGKQFLYDFLKGKGLKPLANRSKNIDYVAKYSTVVG